MRKTLRRACRSADAFGGLCSLEGTVVVKGCAKSVSRDAGVGAASSEPRFVRSASRNVTVEGD